MNHEGCDDWPGHPTPQLGLQMTCISRAAYRHVSVTQARWGGLTNVESPSNGLAAEGTVDVAALVPLPVTRSLLLPATRVIKSILQCALS